MKIVFLVLIFSEMATWQAHPHCPPEAQNRLKKIVQALPEAYLEPPQKREEFDGHESCIRRLQGYALSRGFAVVKVSGGINSKRAHYQYKCIHHGKETRNHRQLELHVERDADGKPTTKRQRESTHTQQRDCPWEVYLLLRKIRGTTRTAWLLGITKENHSHLMAINPL
ncbi:hypothetical protein GJ744_001138 [Endocarpon pusillum]|uniref:Uncharacterized protein n=1 Tax=Endocarpon pusillum TaxID=364733 RepID=A0A8H7DZP2_9EURO|nr:hypothetical protein GJ744_001138 [Endocarpon pusillum]